ncbi:M20 family metallopeptidase [Planctomyces sp. SH-PL62]|uniref:M20 family metallopeptidase n=1 Tax=Planctomyces sp. SH-PL62 TaxID=1636152 RepID=UPI00078D5608|nr:M20 family metallopeptidase [Planctomyces sp. SH-PL62]AMV39478.1 Acetylornithine deacetylase [Planctomyces sp. SH-PL62]
MDELTRLLSDLVSIPSVNPMGRDVTGPEYYEARIGAYLESWFREAGIPVERQTVAPGRVNLIARYESPDRGARSLLFDVHQDTVPVEGMTIPPFEPRVEEGRLYGRGACDVKAGMAAMLLAFRRLWRERPAGSASVVLACTVDEEYTHLGSDLLAETQKGIDLAIVAEPTQLDLVPWHKGSVRWKIRTKGVACHSSKPDLGVNAIYRMARVVDALAGHARVLIESTPHPRLGPPTLSVGRIEGGQSVNVVPDFCEIEIDRRILPGETWQGCVEQARAAVAAGAEGLDGVVFEEPWGRMPALETPLGPWLEPLTRAVEAATGRTPGLIGVPYGTDAGPLGEVGIPAIVFGPGDISQAHTRDEWVELNQVALAVEAYYQIARALG